MEREGVTVGGGCCSPASGSKGQILLQHWRRRGGDRFEEIEREEVGFETNELKWQGDFMACNQAVP